jgi:Zn-dependent protease with chaperone function
VLAAVTARAAAAVAAAAPPGVEVRTLPDGHDAAAFLVVSDDPEVLEVANRATQHLYIVNPIKSFEERAKSLWDTHPPIGERIRALENIAGQMGLLSETR